MKQLLQDVADGFLSDPRSQPFKAAGGVIIVSGLEELPKYSNTPYLALLDSPTSKVEHWSSAVRSRTFSLQAHVVQRVFDRTGVVFGTKAQMGIDELYGRVVLILDMNRFGGKYSKVFLRNEGKAVPLNVGDKKGLQKPLVIEYTRIEAANQSPVV